MGLDTDGRRHPVTAGRTANIGNFHRATNSWVSAQPSLPMPTGDWSTSWSASTERCGTSGRRRPTRAGRRGRPCARRRGSSSSLSAPPSPRVLTGAWSFLSWPRTGNYGISGRPRPAMAGRTGLRTGARLPLRASLRWTFSEFPPSRRAPTVDSSCSSWEVTTLFGTAGRPRLAMAGHDGGHTAPRQASDSPNHRHESPRFESETIHSVRRSIPPAAGSTSAS